MGGPHIPWRPGRGDKDDNAIPLPDGLLPDGAKDDSESLQFCRWGGMLSFCRW